MAALCHFYPGYTIESLRRIPLADVRIMADVMERMTADG